MAGESPGPDGGENSGPVRGMGAPALPLLLPWTNHLASLNLSSLTSEMDHEKAKQANFCRAAARAHTEIEGRRKTSGVPAEPQSDGQRLGGGAEAEFRLEDVT